VNGAIPLRFEPKVAVNHGITLKVSRYYLFTVKEFYKRYDKVVCVSHKLRKRGFNIKLIVIGAPSELPKDDSVEYRYGLTENEKNDLLCKAKALTLPSSHEAFPYVVLKGMACGTPVVVSKAVPEEVLINSFNGIRVNSFNPEDYANALEKLLRDDELWLKLSRNGLEFVKQFDYMGIAKNYINIIRVLNEF
jgi:glycosyltransferase involved in cell wall biosynthesis